MTHNFTLRKRGNQDTQGTTAQLNSNVIPNERSIRLEVERAEAQLDFWLELGELSQLGSAQLAILDLLASSAQLSSPI